MPSSIDYGIPAGSLIRWGAPIPHPSDDGWTHAHCAGALLETAQSNSGTGTVAVTGLDCSLKVGAKYVFEYNLIYSISGFLVGAQFGVGLDTGGLTSIGYSVLLAADTSLKSAATVVENTMIGSGSSWSGGGPWSCCVTGALVLDSTTAPVGRLLMRGQGSGVSITLQPNSTAFFMEI